LTTRMNGIDHLNCLRFQTCEPAGDRLKHALASLETLL
jgi:hypothetical protein